MCKRSNSGYMNRVLLLVIASLIILFVVILLFLNNNTNHSLTSATANHSTTINSSQPVTTGTYEANVIIAGSGNTLNTSQTGTLKYRMIGNNLPPTMDNLKTIAIDEKFNYISNYPSTQVVYINGTGLNSSMSPLVQTSFAFIVKTLYNSQNLSQKSNTTDFIYAVRSLTIMSDNGTIMRFNLPDNAIELYVATNNGTVKDCFFDVGCGGSTKVIPPKNNSNASTHLIYLINQNGANLTTVSFYIYGNYSQASSTAIATNFMKLGIDNITITNVT